MEIKNAKITGTKLTMGEHGCLTFWVFVEGAGWGCGIGGYCIGHGFEGCSHDEFDATGKGLIAMMRIMDVVGVEKWEDLPEHYLRCEVGLISQGIHRIGNILKENWFDLKEFFASEDSNK